MINNGLERSNKQNNEANLDEVSKKEENLKEDKKSIGDPIERDTKSREILVQNEKKDETVIGQGNHKKKVLNNAACCVIL